MALKHIWNNKPNRNSLNVWTPPPRLSPHPALESENCSKCFPIIPYKMRILLLEGCVGIVRDFSILFFFFFLFWQDGDFPLWCSDAKPERDFGMGRWWYEVEASWEAFGIFLRLHRRKRTLNSFYPNDMFRAFLIGPSLSRLIIWRQIGDALLLMMLTPFASWTINEEPHSPPLHLAWPGG